MKVVSITDNEDGSGNLTVDLTEEEIQFLLSYAINHILKKAVKKKK